MNTEFTSTETTVTTPITEEGTTEIMPVAAAEISAVPFAGGFDDVFDTNVISEAFSGDMTTEAGREAYYKCITDCDARVSEMINKTIFVRDIYSAKVNARDKETGEIKLLTRVVLIDTDGCTYTCSSSGVVNSLKALFRMFGAPTWENGLPLTVQQKTLANGRSILTLVYTPQK